MSVRRRAAARASRGPRWWGGLLLLIGMGLVTVVGVEGRFGAVTFAVGVVAVVVGSVLLWWGRSR